MRALDAAWLDLPIDPRRLTVAAVRARCAALPPPGRQWLIREVIAPRSGAILVPVVDLGGEAALVVTQRAPDMLHNSGDWVFPGGRFDPGVDADTAATARREASEELGAPLHRIELAGQLSTYGPIHSGYVLDVYVGLIDAADIRPDPREVADVIIIPISALAAPGAYREEAVMPDVNSGPAAAVSAPRRSDPDNLFGIFSLRPGDDLWGLQGMILSELLRWLLAQDRPLKEQIHG